MIVIASSSFIPLLKSSKTKKAVFEAKPAFFCILLVEVGRTFVGQLFVIRRFFKSEVLKYPQI